MLGLGTKGSLTRRACAEEPHAQSCAIRSKTRTARCAVWKTAEPPKTSGRRSRNPCNYRPRNLRSYFRNSIWTRQVRSWMWSGLRNSTRASNQFSQITLNRGRCCLKSDGANTGRAGGTVAILTQKAPLLLTITTATRSNRLGNGGRCSQAEMPMPEDRIYGGANGATYCRITGRHTAAVISLTLLPRPQHGTSADEGRSAAAVGWNSRAGHSGSARAGHFKIMWAGLGPICIGQVCCSVMGQQARRLNPL